MKFIVKWSMLSSTFGVGGFGGNRNLIERASLTIKWISLSQHIQHSRIGRDVRTGVGRLCNWFLHQLIKLILHRLQHGKQQNSIPSFHSIQPIPYQFHHSIPMCLAHSRTRIRFLSAFVNFTVLSVSSRFSAKSASSAFLFSQVASRSVWEALFTTSLISLAFFTQAFSVGFNATP